MTSVSPALSVDTGLSGGTRLVAFKALVTLALMGFLVAKLEWAAILTRLESASLGPLILAVILVTASVPLAAMRWALLARKSGANMPLALAVRLNFAGLFFGQVLPASVGGDVVRGWLGCRNGLLWQPVVSSLVLDRLMALAAAVLLIFASLPWLLEQAVGTLTVTAAASAINPHSPDEHMSCQGARIDSDIGISSLCRWIEGSYGAPSG